MKTVWYGWLLGAVLVTGCVPGTLLPIRPDSKETPRTTEKPTTRSARPGSGHVTPDQVNENNAHEMGRALEDELKRAEEREP